MSTLTALKSRHYNQLEGVALSAVLQGLLLCAPATLLLKVHGNVHILSHLPVAVAFAVIASVLYALLVQYLGFRFPDAFRDTYEPLFYDPGLSGAPRGRGEGLSFLDNVPDEKVFGHDEQIDDRQRLEVVVHEEEMRVVL